MRKTITEITQQALKLKDKVDAMSYDMAKKEVSLYFSKFYNFGKGTEDIYRCGSLAQAAFSTLFKSQTRQVAISVFISCVIFAGLDLFSNHWQGGFLFSLFIFIISLFFINGKKESLYKRFMENNKIKVKTTQGYMWICKDDIAEQMIKEGKW